MPPVLVELLSSTPAVIDDIVDVRKPRWFACTIPSSLTGVCSINTVTYGENEIGIIADDTDGDV